MAGVVIKQGHSHGSADPNLLGNSFGKHHKDFPTDAADAGKLRKRRHSVRMKPDNEDQQGSIKH